MNRRLGKNARRVTDSYEGPVKIGSVMPDFALPGVDGKIHRLSDFRGTKLMVCFYRFAHCPLCAYSAGNLVGNYKKLAWASRLKVLTVFRTDLDSLQQGLTDGDAPIPRLCERGIYPFTAVADPIGSVASALHIDRHTRSMAIHSELFFAQNTLRRSLGMRTLRTENFYDEVEDHPDAFTLLPTEFLIDEDGVLVDMWPALKVTKSMPLDRIEHFLLTGKKLEESSQSHTFATSINKSLRIFGSEKLVQPKDKAGGASPSNGGWRNAWKSRRRRHTL